MLYVLIVFFSFFNFNDLFVKELIFKKRYIYFDQIKLNVEIADSRLLHSKGLMFRKSIDDFYGMLFIFTKKQYLSFWMKNTFIDLDIGFFDDNKCLLEIKNMFAESLDSVSSSFLSSYALEVNRGWFRRNNITVGSCFKFLD